MNTARCQTPEYLKMKIQHCEKILIYLLNITVSWRESAILGSTIETGHKRTNQHSRKHAHIFSEPEVDNCMSLHSLSFGSSRSGKGGMAWIDLAQKRGRW